MGESLDRGHVMIFSLWDDVEVNMLWLDSALPLVKLVRQYLVSLLPKHQPKHQPSLRLRFQTVATLSTTKIVFILALTPVPVPRPGFLTGQGMTVSSWGENVPLTSLLAVNQPNVWVTTTTLLVF